MGYFAHHTIVLTAWDKTNLKKANAKAEKMFGKLVSEMIVSDCNAQASFFIAPDGSKEGWEESESHNKLREEFKAWLIKQDRLYVDWVEIRFGGDDPEFTNVVAYNDQA